MIFFRISKSALKVLLSLIVLFSPLAASKEMSADYIGPCESVYYQIMQIQFYPEDLEVWHEKVRSRGNSDAQIRDGCLWWIQQPHLIDGNRLGEVASRAAALGLSLYPDDAQINDAVFAICDGSIQINDIESRIHRSGMLEVAMTFGSDRLLERVKGFEKRSENLSDILKAREEWSAKLPIRDKSRVITPEIPMGNDPPLRATPPKAPVVYWIAAAGFIFVGAIFASKYLISGRIKNGSWSLFVLILAVGLCVHFGVGRNKLKNAKMAELSDSSSLKVDKKLDDFVVPPVFESGRSKGEGVGHDRSIRVRGEVTEKNNITDRIRLLLSPFFVAEPENLEEVEMQQDESLSELLKMLESGRPHVFNDIEWMMMVERMVAALGQRESSKVALMEMVAQWIRNPERNIQEVFRITDAMLAWTDDSSFDLLTQDARIEEKRQIISLQATLLNRANGEDYCAILDSVVNAQIKAVYNKEQEIVMLVDDESAAGMIKNAFSDLPLDEFLGRILLTASKRVRRNPDSLGHFREVLMGVPGTDYISDRDKLKVYCDLAAGGDITWIFSDADVLEFIKGVKSDGVRSVPLLVEIKNYRAELAALRVGGIEGTAREEYARIVLAAADDVESVNYLVRASMVEAMHRFGLMAPDEIHAKYGDDVHIGGEVKRLLNIR